MENYCREGPPVGTYNPSETKLSKFDDTGKFSACKSIKTSASRMDEYKLKRDSERSPGSVYDIKDARDISYRDKFLVTTESFGKKGTRFLPKKVDVKPSPHEYTIRGSFESKGRNV
jgi:hypothetical protein